VIATVDILVQSGWAGPLERCFVQAMSRIGNERDPLALLGALVASRFTSQKHVCADLERLAGRAVADSEGGAVADLQWPALGDWTAALQASPLVADGELGTPLVLEGRRLYLYRYWDYERRLASGLLQRASSVAPDVDEELLAAGLTRRFADADPAGLQQRAAAVAVRRRLAVISGGPGTGKTTAVSHILGLIGEQVITRGQALPRVLLLAPTGKAAARLVESIREAALPQEASTIHRALGYRPDRPSALRHGADNPLAADVVVVDEASMVDLALMAKLVEAVPREARLILLGDRDQLSSVDAGSVLGDICGRGGEPDRSAPGLGECVVHLSHSYRFADDSAIGSLARAINEDRADDAVGLLAGGAGGAAVQLVEEGDPAAVERLVGDLAADAYREMLDQTEPLERLNQLRRFRVLCAHRRGPAGAEQIGVAIERQLADAGAIAATDAWYDGKPVLITSNDYQLGLFNGDTGLALADPDTGQLRVCFVGADGELRAVAPYRLPSHETVYATTVHKAQGSELDEVVVVLPPRISPVVTRELLYTAVTRARQKVTIYGTEAVLRQAVAERTVRYSGLRELLWG
jgi:exodeoxyribonuclease V alpha subunit